VIRNAFTRARAALPAVLFFDELETIVGKRGEHSSDSSSSVTDRVMATFLNEMDGIEACKGLLVLGATNRPDMIDAGIVAFFAYLDGFNSISLPFPLM
jgi:SpoVK/Ycf46/Vps4 family AAA+-type ATPase